MSEESETGIILNAIDRLTFLKNRPNLPNLTWFLLRKHGFSAEKSMSILKDLKISGDVKEIFFRGDVSFRNTSRWKQPRRRALKRLNGDRADMVRSEASGDPGGLDSQLEASLIDQLVGPVVKDSRKRIQLETQGGDTVHNSSGPLDLNSETIRIDLDMDQMSDSDSTNQPSSPESNRGSTNTSTSLNTSQSSLPAEPPDPNHKRNQYLRNLDKSIDKVVKYLDDSKTNDIMTETGKEVIKKSKESENTCQLNAKPQSDLPDKRRRIIRKKTIYDPSEFELTPVVRRRRRGLNSIVTVAGRGSGRGRRGGKVNRSWGDAKDGDACSETRESDTNQAEESVEKKARGGPPMNVNKKCHVCSAAAEKNQPSIISCSLCLNIAHKDCLKSSSFYKGSKKWRCEDCKEYNPVLCVSCEQDKPEKKHHLLMCDFCEDFFHASCHYPPVELPLEGDTWRCGRCPTLEKRLKLKIGDDGDNLKDNICKDEVAKTEEPAVADISPQSPEVKSTSPPPCISQENKPKEVKAKSEPPKIKRDHVSSDDPFVFPLTFSMATCVRHKPEEAIPLVDDWTVQQVSEYFHEKFGQDVADAFLEQEIDGKLLKEMSRQFVTNDLGLELGVALKVLYYVKKIQLGTNLLHQLWA